MPETIYDALGRRMKRYEEAAGRLLTKRSPVILRIDGRAFHTLTKGLAPFDPDVTMAMYMATTDLLEEAQGAKLAYVQSDEISILLTDYDTVMTDSWFGYVTPKLNSVSASIVTASWAANKPFVVNRRAYFDCRAFNVPENDVTNYFLWRALDWKRNSVSIYARQFYSHRELHGKGHADMHEMLHAKGKNWATDLSPQEKNGTWIWRHADTWAGDSHLQPNWDDINKRIRMVAPFMRIEREPPKETGEITEEEIAEIEAAVAINDADS